jgi:uncharacterized YigZ family protein
LSGYKVLAAPIFLEKEEKRSEFLAYLHPVSSREESLEWVNYYREKYSDANHVCWAYVIGNTRQPLTQAFSDDGEPSGTAGKPMLHVLTEREVGNSVAIVVRYFGGVKLGAGGLVRAYSGAVSEAVNLATLVQVIPKTQINVTISFAREAKIRHLIEQVKGTILAVNYTQDVALEIELAVADKDEFCRRAIEETSGDARIQDNEH